jgi:hypothetical protein
MKLAKLTTDRTFGLEIEFINRSSMSKDVLAQYINKKFRKLDCISEGYNHTTQNHWKIVTDASCGLELVSPILSGKKGMENAKCIIDCLASIEGVTVNRECGIHVHVGASDLTTQGMKNVVMFYAKNQHIIGSVLAPSRRSNNRWCNTLTERYGDTTQLESRLTTAETVNEVVTAFNGTRYQTVNLQAYSRQRTVEFRQHGGSLDSEKILNWAHWLITTVEMCNTENVVVKRTVKTNQTLAFKKCFGHTSKVVLDFMLGRANHFGFENFGTVKTISVVKRWEAVCELTATVFTVNKLSNGGIEVKEDGNSVKSGRKTLLHLLGVTDTNQTTRQLGALLFSTIGQLEVAVS